jgi:hypothetical protein
VAAAGADEAGVGEAFRSSPGAPVAVAVGSGVPAAAVEPGASAAGVVAESSGRRTVLASPVVLGEELLRVWVLAARAADPVRRIPAMDSARAVVVLMFQQ